MNSEHEHEKSSGGEIEFYGDENIASKNAPVPRWLIVNYIFWPIFGLFLFYLYWNGSYGWLDRGYWQQLQRAANTTYPFHTDVRASVLPQQEFEPIEESKVDGSKDGPR